MTYVSKWFARFCWALEFSDCWRWLEELDEIEEEKQHE